MRLRRPLEPHRDAAGNGLPARRRTERPSLCSPFRGLSGLPLIVSGTEEPLTESISAAWNPNRRNLL